MATQQFFKQVRLVGGDIALDFVNTQTGPHGGPAEYDALGDYQDLLRWAASLAIASENQIRRLSEDLARNVARETAVFHEARRIRSYLHELFESLAHHEPPPAAVLNYLHEDEARALEQGQLVVDGDKFAWDWSACTDPRAPVFPVVHSAVLLLTAGPVRRVRQCQSCRFMFLDQSKNASRRWCSMDDCGKTEKMHNYVSRRRASNLAQH
ncbi:MAG TPA: ABATE domain-containing protein [Acidimicrobiales bacterium]|nr:ABATE domain-containing protein [Acidimicrobiales bacterium]